MAKAKNPQDEIVFEMGVPLPANRPTRGPSRNFRLGDMPLGASFVRPHRDYVALNMATRRARDQYGYKFAIRLLDEGIRVWRVA